MAVGWSGDQNALPFTRLPGDDAEDESVSCRTNESVLPSGLQFMDTRSPLTTTQETAARSNSAAVHRSMRACKSDFHQPIKLNVLHHVSWETLVSEKKPWCYACETVERPACTRMPHPGARLAIRGQESLRAVAGARAVVLDLARAGGQELVA